jgi:hypothetical protein
VRYTDFAKRVTPDDAEKLEQLASQFEPELQQAILDALAYQRDIDIDQLTAALESGDAEAVTNLLHLDEYSIAAGPVGKELAAATIAGAVLTSHSIAVPMAEVRFTFDEHNPAVVNFMQRYQLALIRQINDNTKAGVRQVLNDSLIRGANPKQAAVDVQQIIGLTDKQAQAVINFRRQLEAIHTTGAAGWGLGNKIDRVNGSQVFKPNENGNPQDGIMRRRLRDFRYDRKLQGAVQSGKPLSQADIDKMVDAYSRKYLKYRAQTIARTESMRALNAGARQAWVQAIATGKVNQELVRRSWIVTHDERLCQWCAPVPRMNPGRGVKFDEPFKTPLGDAMHGPLHPSCRCTEWIQQYEPQQLEDEDS